MKLNVSTTAGKAADEGEVLTAQSLGSGDGDWRVIDLWSEELSPWEARLVWSGGGATTGQVFRGNLSTSVNIQARAAMRTADVTPRTSGPSAVRSARRTSAERAGTSMCRRPRGPRFGRLELSDNTLFGTAFIELLDANATTRARYGADKQAFRYSRSVCGLRISFAAPGAISLAAPRAISFAAPGAISFAAPDPIT